MTSSSSVYDAYEARSWKSLALRARGRGPAFSVGRRESPYIWDLDGERRLLDCAVGGGVHSLGHANPEIASTLREAIDSGLDGGLWTFPSPAMLDFQDALAAAAPFPILNRSVVTLSSTASVDLAIQLAARITGRTKVAAYRHGYHGGGGYSAMVTGSEAEGVTEFYGLPNPMARFFEHYGNLNDIDTILTPEVAAIILEPFDYESWEPAKPEYLNGIQQLCEERGTLLILDETRTGLGRSGRMWMCEYSGVAPDMLVTGKGLSGGLYPVSALLTTEAIYDATINAHPFAYSSSLGGNEISCVVGQRVIEICKSETFLSSVATLSNRFRERFDALCADYPQHFTSPGILGGVVTMGVHHSEAAACIAAFLFDHGILCHSTSLVAPTRIKFFPVLTASPAIADEVADGLAAYARSR